MVAIVDLAGERREANGQEGNNLDTFLTEMFQEATMHLPTAHIIINDANLHPTLRLVNERIGHQASQGIVLKDIHLDMDMMLGSGDVLQQFRKEGIAVRHDVYHIVLEGQRQVLVDEEVNELLMALRHMQVVLFDETQHGTLRQLVDGTLTDKALLAMVDAKEEIEHHTNNRYEENHQRPRHRLCGLSVVEHYVDNGCCHQYPQERHPYYI